MSRPVGPRVPGYNVDRLDIGAGCAQAKRLGYTDGESLMVVEYALMRWARGEEEGGQRTALSGGIDLTSWYSIIAAARATAEVAHEQAVRAAAMTERYATPDLP